MTNFDLLAEPYFSPTAFEAVWVLCPSGEPSSWGDSPYITERSVRTISSTLLAGNSYKSLVSSAVMDQRRSAYIGFLRVDALDVFLNCLDNL